MSVTVAVREALEVNGMRALWWPAAGRSARERDSVLSAATWAVREGESGAMGSESECAGGDISPCSQAGKEDCAAYSPKLSYNHKWDFIFIPQFPAHYSRPPLVRFGPRTPRWDY